MNRPDIERSSQRQRPRGKRSDESAAEAIYSSDFFIASLSNFFFFSSVNAFSLLPLYIQSLGGTESQIGGIMGTYSLTAILAQPLAGAMTDRFGRKRFLLLGSALGVVAAVGFALSSRLDVRFYLLRLAQGVGYSAFYISNLTIVADMVPESRRGEAVGLFGISGLITIALSPALGEQLIQVSGFSVFFLAAAAAAAGSLLVSLALDARHGACTASVGPIFPSLIPSARTMPPIVISFVFGVVSGTVFVFLPTHARQVGLARIGVFYIAYSVAAIGIRLAFGTLSDRWGRMAVILPALLLMAAGSLGLVWLATSVGLLAVGALTGMAHGLLFPALSAYVIDLSGLEERGQALGAFSTAILLGSGLASLVFGVVAERLGYPSIFLAAAGIPIAACLVFYRLGHR
jgi:MFS family permease